MAASWLGAVEGYYGPPLAHEERLELVAWMAENGFNAFAYAPKHDPFERDRWREPHPEAEARQLAELIAAGAAAGVEVVMVISPGLDWRDGDNPALVAKLRTFTAMGATALGVAWDDVPPGGEDLGRAHGAAVAAAVAGIGPGVRWITCPTDYALTSPTPDLHAFVAQLPAEVDVMWTGPGIVSPNVDATTAARLRHQLGRALLFAENFPVNDGTMGGVLHLGPYPPRDPGLPAVTAGVFANLMARPRASRVGLAATARFWQDPKSDREATWRDIIAATPGLEPLALASRGWVGNPGADPSLTAGAAAALAGEGSFLEYLAAGCRAGLEPRLAAEVEPWLEQWEAEAATLAAAIRLARAGAAEKSELAMLVALLWGRARTSAYQAFGTRWAYYPVTRREGDALALDAAALVAGANLTDAVCAAVLGRGPAPL